MFLFHQCVEMDRSFSIEELTDNSSIKLFGFVSLNNLIKYLQTKLKEDDISRLELVLKFNDISDNGNFKNYNFKLAGFYLDGVCYNDKLNELINLKGLSFSEKRGEFLLSNFENNPFIISHFTPYILNMGTNNLYYGFKINKIDSIDFPYVDALIRDRERKAEMGGVYVDEHVHRLTNAHTESQKKEIVRVFRENKKY